MLETTENTRGKSRLYEFKKHSAAAIALLVVLVCAMIFVFTRFSLTGAGKNALLPDESAAPQSAAPESTSPAPSASPTPVPTESASPTPVPSASPDLDFIKTAVIIDGNRSVVLASRQAAEELINTSVAHFELLCPGTGMITTLENSVEYVNADASEATTPFEEALSIMTGDASPLRVRTTFARNDIETIPHNTVERSSDEHYIGTRFVSVYGRDGKKLQLREYTYLNGILENLEITEERVLCDPADGLVLIGARPIPADLEPAADFGFGDCKAPPSSLISFSQPVSASVERNFGFYSGAFNRGINYACPNASAIFASCSGTVSAVISRGDLGITVDISHGSGYVTRYSLLASSDLSVGDSIEKGSQVGISGAEGLHFEVIVSGVPRNPRFYLP